MFWSFTLNPIFEQLGCQGFFHAKISRRKATVLRLAYQRPAPRMYLVSLMWEYWQNCFCSVTVVTWANRGTLDELSRVPQNSPAAVFRPLPTLVSLYIYSSTHKLDIVILRRLGVVLKPTQLHLQESIFIYIFIYRVHFFRAIKKQTISRLLQIQNDNYYYYTLLHLYKLRYYLA